MKHTRILPVNQLQLGNRTYNRQELQSILQQAVRGNGLVQLARQEIIAKLNIASGVDGNCVAQTLAAVDALIGNLVIPPVGNGFLRPSAYAGTLTRYNGGALCAPQCEWSPPPDASPTPATACTRGATAAARIVIARSFTRRDFVSGNSPRLRACGQ